MILINKIKAIPCIRKLNLEVHRLYFRHLCNKSHKKATEYFFKGNMGYPLDLENPKTLNEKIQWLKLYDYGELVTQCADKYMLREYCCSKDLAYLLPHLHNVYNDSNEIDFSKLPKKYVLKCNHGAGYNIICYDNEQINKVDVRKTLNKWMKEDYSYFAGEFHYQKIRPRIICEEFIEEFESKLPTDYKIYCFHGVPKIIMVCQDRTENSGAIYSYFDLDWNFLSYSKMYKTYNPNVIKPKHFDEMIEVSKKLSAPFKFVRIDYYDTDKQLILGEMTFTPAGGIDYDVPYAADLEMGRYININS